MNSLDLAAHIIKFDSDDFSTHLPFTIRTAPKVLTPIPWPSDSAPIPEKLTTYSANNSLPKCDVLIVTWTVEEAKALSDVLTPGYNSKTGWYAYTKGYTDYKSMFTAISPAIESKRLGSYFVTNIGKKKVLCFKSEVHMSTDSIQLPIQKLWQQIISDVTPKIVITTGTAGGIGANANLGDVVISKKVRFDCTKKFKSQPFATQQYKATNNLKTPKPDTLIKKLLAANSNQLPTGSPTPSFFDDTDSYNKAAGIVTTDFFAFDNIQNTYGLQKLGSAVEMGDAVLAMVCKQIGKSAPEWICIRNASDPEIKDDTTIQEQKKKAAQIYEQYGYWTTVCSAIACWAFVVAN
jgi:nucleoside phosphorylase